MVTGEYPPQPGGVSDYSRILARSLAASGDTVHVYAPETPHAGLVQDPGVRVHRLPGHFGPRALRQLTREVAALPRNARLLVQYVPHAFGCRAMNVPFCLWLWFEKSRAEIWTFFHEVHFPIRYDQPLRYNILGLVTRVMAAIVSCASRRRFVMTKAWKALLPRHRAVEHIGVPSNFPIDVSDEHVAEYRRRSCPTGSFLIGHVGTYGPSVTRLLEPIVRSLTAGDRRTVLLLGRGSETFGAEMHRKYADLRDRVRASGPLASEEMARAVGACDLVVQPYVDGISSRRGSAMAGLALGVPIVTNDGPSTEPFWRKDGAVSLATEPTGEAFGRAVTELLESAEKRQRLSRAARDTYARRFAIERTIEILKN